MVNKENIIETFTELAPRYEEVVNAELDRFWGWSYVGFVNQLILATSIPQKKDPGSRHRDGCHTNKGSN